MEKTFYAKINNLMEQLVYIAVIIIPAAFLPFVHSIFSTPKLYLFRIITLIILFLFISFNKRIKRMPFVGWALALYAFISILNTIFSTNIWSSIFGTYGRFIGIVTLLNLLLWVYIVFALINTKKKIITLLWCSLIAAFLIAVYGILQHYGLFNDIFNWSQDPLERMFATIGHSNHTAAYIGMNLMIAIGFLISKNKNKLQQIFLILSIIIFSSALVMTASRGSMFAVFVCLVFWAVYLFKRYWKIILLLFCALILSAVIFYKPLSQLEIVERTLGTIEFVKQGNVPDRVSWWYSAFEMIKDKPILGHGLSTFRDVYNRYRRLDYRLPDDAQDHITPESAHMEYLNIWALQGTLGFIAYLIMIFGVFGYIYPRMKHDNIIYAVLLAMAVYLLQVLVSFGTITTLFMFYTFMGIGLSLVSKQDYIKFKFNFLRIFAGILIFVFGFYYSFCMLAADYYYQQAEIFEARADGPRAILSYEKAISYMPYISEYYEAYADFLFEIGIRMPDADQVFYLQDADSFYDKALALNSNLPYVHLNKAMVNSRLYVLFEDDLLKADKYRETCIKEHLTALSLSRNNPVYPYKYAKTLFFFQEYDKALEQFEDTLKIRNPYKDTENFIQQCKKQLGLTE
jgi:O-antigen ligase